MGKLIRILGVQLAKILDVLNLSVPREPPGNGSRSKDILSLGF